MSYRQVRVPYPTWLAALLFAVLSGSVAYPLQAQSNTPARPVPPVLHGDLEPVDPDPLPPDRDTTDFNEFRQLYSSVPWFVAVDVANGYLVMGLAHGVQVWDARTTPASPKLLGVGRWSEFPVQAIGETKWPGNDLSVPDGTDTVAAHVGVSQIGLTIWDLSRKSSPEIVYQQPGSGYNEVHAATIGGRHYAFVANKRAELPGLYAYDMSAALARATKPCVDNTQGSACTGVQLGRLGELRARNFVGGTGNFVVTSSAVSRGLEILDVSNPAAARSKIIGLTDQSVYGVEMFQRAGSTYLVAVVEVRTATGAERQGRIYDVSCLTSGGCSGLGQPIWSQVLPMSAQEYYLSYSESGATPFVYFGNSNRTAGGPQREYLFNVSDPAHPQEITPKQTATLEGAKTDYWSWYYPLNPTGFINVGPRRGVFWGEYFYRAGFSIFDIHRRTGGLPPQANFTWQSAESDGKIYGGPTPSGVTFTDSSTSNPTLWSWFFTGGSPSSSALRNPTGVKFTTPGSHAVTLAVTNAVGDGTVTKNVTVLDPVPALASVTSNVMTVQQCQPVTFTANEVTGQPPLSFAWRILQSTVPIDVPSGSQSVVWVPKVSGSYTAEATVGNAAGEATQASQPVTVNPLQPLPSPGFVVPDPSVSFGTASFDATSVSGGATEWRWTFGDGTTTDWISDPVSGPQLSHVYAVTGTYQVTLEVRQVSIADCSTPTASVESAPLEVTIVQAIELTADFKIKDPICFPVIGICASTVNQVIAFTDNSSGAEVWSYDWDGDGTFEDSGHTSPVLSHTYTSVGKFSPKLRVSRGGGAQTDEGSLLYPIQVDVPNTPPPPPPPTNPPRISVSTTGLAVGEPGTPLNFQAVAFNCTPTSTGWSWVVTGGGIIDGLNNRANISVTWSTIGTKTVQARNSACGSAAGSVNVVIASGSTPPPPTSGLQAVFSFNPAEPQRGVAVSFDGSASSGSPMAWSWDFGDGTPIVESQTATTTHSFSKVGTFKVTLTVLKEGTGPGCFDNLKICVAETTKNITIGGSTPPPPPPPPPVQDKTACPDEDDDAACLLSGRFRVSVAWTNQRTGDSGVGHRLGTNPRPNQDTTGFFWFFNPNSTELVVKIINGVPVNNAFWFFYGALTDVEYHITVEDQLTGATKVYDNTPSNVCGRADTLAFPQGDNLRVESFSGALTTSVAPAQEAAVSSLTPLAAAAGEGSCEAGPQTLCLLSNRFEVEVDWENQRDGSSGLGTVVAGTDQTGYFWFFNANNIELVVKAIDARGATGNFWFFYGALSDVHYTIRVRDTVTEQTKEYENLPGNICGLADTTTF